MSVEGKTAVVLEVSSCVSLATNTLELTFQCIAEYCGLQYLKTLVELIRKGAAREENPTAMLQRADSPRYL